jgi:hypothetical protein
MSFDPGVPDDVLRKIKEGASEVRSAGDALNARIRAFEEWVAKLPGRVETTCTISSDADGENSTILNLKREGKEWTLYRYEWNEQMEHASDYKPLRDASVLEKAFAVSQLPKVLTEMVTAQKSMVEQAQRSTREFDTFAKAIGLKVGE